MFSVVRSSLARSAASAMVARRAMSAAAAGHHAAAPKAAGEAPIDPPGGKAGEMPTSIDQATGKEREEYLAALKGENLFSLDFEPPKHFGTKANPIVYFTHFEDRIIGCEGPHDEGHETIWWNPKVNTESRCPECGQVFHLKKNPHAHHHDDGHGHH